MHMHAAPAHMHMGTRTHTHINPLYQMKKQGDKICLGDPGHKFYALNQNSLLNVKSSYRLLS